MGGRRRRRKGGGGKKKERKKERKSRTSTRRTRPERSEGQKLLSPSWGVIEHSEVELHFLSFFLFFFFFNLFSFSPSVDLAAPGPPFVAPALEYRGAPSALLRTGPRRRGRWEPSLEVTLSGGKWVVGQDGSPPGSPPARPLSPGRKSRPGRRAGPGGGQRTTLVAHSGTQPQRCREDGAEGCSAGGSRNTEPLIGQ